MVTRAGALDQGNIIPNLIDAAESLPPGQPLFLAGSAINSIKDSGGKVDPSIGAHGMQEAIAIWRAGDNPEGITGKAYIDALRRIAHSQGMKSLIATLEQRYKLG